MTGPGLGREVGVGDLAPHHADQVAVARRRARSACSGSLKRPTPTTGSSTASRMALGMNIAYPGGTCMLASIMNSVAVATPIDVLM